jgi:hypothetical protein
MLVEVILIRFLLLIKNLLKTYNRRVNAQIFSKLTVFE